MKIYKYTKIIIHLGLTLTVTAITLSAIMNILAGKAGNYYLLMGYSRDFIILSRQYMGLTAIGAVITEIICRHIKDNETE